MPVFSEYLYTFFKEKNSQEMAKKWGKSRRHAQLLYREKLGNDGSLFLSS